jgi:ketosteroid isomerase-like protein
MPDRNRTLKCPAIAIANDPKVSLSFTHKSNSHSFSLHYTTNQLNMKNLTLFGLAIVTLLFSLPSCKEAGTAAQPETAAVNMDSVKMQITAMENAYAAASNAKDVDGVAVYYAADAESLADGEPTRVGMDAIKAGIKKDFDMDTTGTTVAFATTGLWADGKYATETGTITNKNADGSVKSTGKYMTLFELRDGKYVAIRDIWNMDSK